MTASGVGQMEGNAAKGSPEVMVLEEESTSIPLTPSIAEGSVLAGMSRREGSVAIVAGVEPSMALTSVGSDSPTRGEPLLRWVSPEDSMSTLFTLDDDAESKERESLDVGSHPCSKPWTMPEVPCAMLLFPLAGYSLDPASRPFLSLYIFCILTIVSFQSLITRSQGKSWFVHEQKEN